MDQDPRLKKLHELSWIFRVSNNCMIMDDTFRVSHIIMNDFPITIYDQSTKSTYSNVKK